MVMCLRRYRLDGNPLRRRCDRWESVVLLAASALVLVSVLPAVLAGRAVYESAVEMERAVARHRVVATLLEDAPVTRISFTEVPAARPTATARWTTSAGLERIASVPVPALAKAGSTVTVWLDSSGMSTSPPPDPVVLRLRGIAAGLLVAVVAALVALASFAGARWWLDQLRYRQWGLAWERADDTRRRPRQP
ncbi:hypothetical protein [Nonomuraea sp. NPDC048826]|uniref:Rv1733c family protein n=1 Tax=Nonomuraea sp. NPDC048826 TaxID=3364347 RepID=UPI003718B184